MLKVVLVLINLAKISLQQNLKFCQPPYQPNLCPNYDHVACLDYFDQIENCPIDAQKINLNFLKDWILEKHNSFRNSIAGGGLQAFPPAAQMPTLVGQNFPLFHFTKLQF